MIVRGTQAEQPAILEFGKDTVYVRKNVHAVEEENFTGWEYEENQYTYPEYIKVQQEDGDNVKLAIAELAEIIGG